MTKQMITIHNVETNEVIEREMTADELAWYKSINAPYEPTAEEAEAMAAKELAQSKLAALGLTTDDLKALGL
jgi:hypothetical protein